MRTAYLALASLSGCLLAGCASTSGVADAVPNRPDVAPASAPAVGDALVLDAAQVRPLYREIVAIDLVSVARVALAQNLDILAARQEVEAARGRHESAIGATLPVLVPAATFEHLQGTTRDVEGRLIGVNFSTFQPGLAVQWVLNPGRVVADIITSKKRIRAGERAEEAVVLETLRQAAVQYEDLALAQARVAAASQSLVEAEELLRVNSLRLRTGNALAADVSRAEARAAERRGSLVLELDRFYQASIQLALTLHLDAAVTLIPAADRLPPITLVRDDLDLDALLAIAVLNRPDLESVRIVAEAVAVERKAVWWGALGPQFQASYQYSGITGHADNVVQGQGISNNLIINPGSANGAFSTNPAVNGGIREAISRASQRLAGRRDETAGFSDQHRAAAGVAWRLSFSTFGDLKTARALEARAVIDAEQHLDRVKAAVVSAVQSSRTRRELIAARSQEVASADEALRLSQTTLEAGMATTLDVLQAQDALTAARVNYAEATVRYNQAQISLLAALGLLSESALAAAESAFSAADAG